MMPWASSRRLVAGVRPPLPHHGDASRASEAPGRFSLPRLGGAMGGLEGVLRDREDGLRFAAAG